MDSDRSRVNWEEFVRCQVKANETSEAKHQFSGRLGNGIMRITIFSNLFPSGH